MKIDKSTVLTCLGAAGVIGTSVLAVIATPEALDRLALEEAHKGYELTPLEMIKAAWKSYIPSLLVGTATISCIFGANALNKRQQAALTSAYAILNETYREYRRKVQELYGADADVKIREVIAKDEFERSGIYPEDSERYLFYDPRIGYFESSMEVVEIDDNLECHLIEVP